MLTKLTGILAGTTSRRGFVGLLGMGAAMLASTGVALAQGHTSGGGTGHNGGDEGGSGHSGGDEGGGSGRNGAGRTPQQRAVRHRARTGQTLGGGEHGARDDGHGGGGHDAGEDGHSAGGDAIDSGSTLSEGIVAGGSSGAEHFVHDSPGYWGVDGKVLRR